MKSLLFCLSFLLLHTMSLEALIVHQPLPIKEEWKKENLLPFDELILSWNAARPSEGSFLFYVSIKTQEWSPWLLYASWGKEGQSSFVSTTEEAPIKTFQDALEVLKGQKATGFQIKIIAKDGAPLHAIHGIHVYTNGDKIKEVYHITFPSASIYLKVGGLSQMCLHHPRHADLCSPTSTTAVTRYLSNNEAIDPISFAQNVWDAGFDIFGNWVFNVAQASSLLGSDWDCWIERLNGFEGIYQHLTQGTPVVVSLKGPIPGGAKPYAKGHLLAVIGFDPIDQKVRCMDPAFPSDSETHVSYALSDFLQAWNRRGNAAYIFSKKS